MMEVAISLAIIGFALVAIIGVLPYGMNTQRDNREETVINQDATMLIEAIRNGAYQHDELTNYIYAVTNYWQEYDGKGQPTANNGYAGYTYLNAAYNNTPNSYIITNGARIVGLLSTPQFSDGFGGVPMADVFGKAYVSNHVFAYVHSISGLAVEKPPQDNPIMREDTFTYRIYVVNAPVPVDTNTFNPNNLGAFATQLAANQRELRLLFSWPLQPNGAIGSGRQNYRATIAGRLLATNYFNLGQTLYFYRPQNFVSAP
jgi:type II secretory pathway pseudopilin PulG